jgi:hypothetical protein
VSNLTCWLINHGFKLGSTPSRSAIYPAGWLWPFLKLLLHFTSNKRAGLYFAKRRGPAVGGFCCLFRLLRAGILPPSPPQRSCSQVCGGDNPLHSPPCHPHKISSAAAMALSSSRPKHLLRPLLRGFHASARALARVEPHEFSKPSEYLGSWEPAAEPREAWARLDRLRKGYASEVRELRRQYAYEVQLLQAERQRKADARAEAARAANQERKAAKLAAAQTRAAERRAFEEDFRQTLVRFDPSPSFAP